jgi:sialic acid synthase SpsE
MEGSLPRIIAEIGTAHQGDIQKAEELIQAAAESGADYAKFQTVFADEIVPANVGNLQLPGGTVPIYDRFKQFEQDADFYHQLQQICQKHHIEFLSSPFGIKSARILRNISVSAIKIASPELNHIELLHEVREYDVPIILSSGVSQLSDIELAIQTISQTQKSTPPIFLLHCITAYPAPEQEYNLRLLPLYASLFNVGVGVSDHSLDAELVPALATAVGAQIIEKHITLSRSHNGLDDPIALEPADFLRMSTAIRQAAEDGPEATIAACSDRYGANVVQAVLGDGQKRLANSEKENYGRSNRSLHALRDLKAGNILQKSDFAALRTEKILRPGIAPQYAPLIIGKKISANIPAGEGIRWEDLLH